MTAAAELAQHAITIIRPVSSTPILSILGRGEIAIKAGTKIVIDGDTHEFPEQTPVATGELVPGRDYGVSILDDGTPALIGVPGHNPLQAGAVAGFHFAPANCIRNNGDGAAAINPYSPWDIGFRPNCLDPRGMTMVSVGGVGRIWADIYLLGTNHHEYGTSRCGATIADGRDLPMKPDGSGRYKRLDYATAVEICAHHGKRLLGAEEYFAAAYGVEERCSRSRDPIVTGSLDDDAQRFISRFGLFDATGTMDQWGTDGHPDDPRPSLFGGSWFYGSDAGSRYAALVYWADFSYGNLGVRAACDHLELV